MGPPGREPWPWSWRGRRPTEAPPRTSFCCGPRGTAISAAWSKKLAAGALYRFQLDDDPAQCYPDPATRFQPAGPLGPSEVIDPRAFPWTDQEWAGVSLPGQVLYEMHIGAFTPEGTYRSAAQQLPYLAALGITVLEIMPVADFTGDFGWGYDGVNLLAPTRLYGRPDDLRAFVNEAHRLGLAVILDVVYHRVGDEGNFLSRFSPDYFTNRYRNEWGNA